MGLAFDVVPSRIEENEIPSETPQDHVLRLAETKVRDVAIHYPNRWVIAADTIVYIHGMILGKPKNKDEAMEMLHRLSGNEHMVLTGFSVCHLEKGKRDKEVIQTAVKIKNLTLSEMEWYVHTGEPFDKAGAYAVQGIGAFMIESIQGSYTNVIGLPLCELVQMLQRLGAIIISDLGIQILD